MNTEITRIAISGAYGRMGKNLISTIQEYNSVHLDCAIVKKKNSNVIVNNKIIQTTEDIKQYINEFDVLIDFSTPESTLYNLKMCQMYNKNIVIGTTGFVNNDMDQIKKYSKNIGIVMSSNFSIGINIILKLLKKTAQIIDDSYDIEIIESHHRYKLDSPSGTALQMSQIIAETKKWDAETCNIYRKKEIKKNRENNKIGLSIIRGGDTIGEHEVMFIGNGEKISIKHQANSRNTFSKGAIESAIWVKNKKYGLFSMIDVLTI